MKTPKRVVFSACVLFFNAALIIITLIGVFAFNALEKIPLDLSSFAIAAIALIMMVVVAPIEILLGIGLLRRWRWAWVATIVFGLCFALLAFPPIGTIWGALIIIPLIFPKSFKAFWQPATNKMPSISST